MSYEDIPYQTNSPIVMEETWLKRVWIRLIALRWFVNRAFRLVVRSSFVFANNNWDWLKLITWFILANHSNCYCLQKEMKIEIQVEILSKASSLNDITRQFTSRTIWRSCNCYPVHLSLMKFSELKANCDLTMSFITEKI